MAEKGKTKNDSNRASKTLRRAMYVETIAHRVTPPEKPPRLSMPNVRQYMALRRARLQVPKPVKVEYRLACRVYWRRSADGMNNLTQEEGSCVNS